MTERRTRLRGGSLLAHRDPSRSPDPQVRALVSQLAQLPAGPAPSAQFRAELRAQLVAVAPRLVAEGGAAAPARQDTGSRRAPVGAGSLLRRLAAVRVGRPVAAVLGVLCVFALLLGGAVWISGKAMPGDTLYTVKRATENARLALAGSDTEKAKDYLSFAKTRAGEVAKLLGRPTAAAAGGSTAASGVSAHTAKLVGTTLDSADGDVRDASRLLTGKAVSDRSTAPLSIMIQWAPAQLTRLQQIAARLPSGAVLDRVQSSARLVQAALTRSDQLRTGIGCACLASAPSDQLGPVPCTACAANVPVQGPSGTVPAPGSTGHQQAPPAAPGATTSTTAPGQAQPSPGARTGSSAPNPTRSSTAPGAGDPSRRAGSSTSGAQPGAGAGSSNRSATTGAGAGSSPAGTDEPTGAPSSPQPSRTCLIVLLGHCI